ncbi:MAG: 3-oxoacyl-ACP reductase FabG [Firmicutes bacterium]|nr:3-oxoacyl-ACP reductase FabG [Bacillota bacterium]
MNDSTANKSHRVAVVTGGSRGIGAAVCRSLAAEGFFVVINYREARSRAEALAGEILSHGGQADIFGADVSRSKDADALISFAAEKGALDVLICSAGIASQSLFDEISDAEWERMIGVNLSGTFYVCRAAAREMIRSKRGSIVTVSSMWGVVGASCEVHYSAAKAGVIGLTKALAKELGPSGIRVNCVAPGVIDTEMNAHLSQNDLSALAESTPLCRIGTPEEIADAVTFFATERSSFVTGQILTADGGFSV